MKLHVVMPVVNAYELTEQAIDTIHNPCNIILIDNASSDYTQRYGQANHNADITYARRLQYVRNEKPKSVSASWNQGIKLALEDPECEYIAILNNDILLHPKTLTHLMAFMDKTGYLVVTGDNIKDRMSHEVLFRMELPHAYTDFDLWKIEGWRAEGPDFSCYIINRETIRVIGFFDENFKGAYCEDWDFHRRIQAAREHIEKHNDFGIDASRAHAKRLSTAPYYHFASQTITRNPQIRNAIAKQHGLNQSYYIRKWGAIHDQAMDGAGFKTPFGRADMNWRDWFIE